MNVEKHGAGFAIRESRFSPALVKAGRATPGMVWDPEGRVWTGDRGAVELCVKMLQRAGLRLSGLELLAEDDDLGEPLVNIASKNIRPYQTRAVHFLLARKRALLADAMGLGKSCSALTAARALSSRTLIVCPSYVRTVWFNERDGGEIKKWWPSAVGDETDAWAIFLPAGMKATPIADDARIVIIHYDILPAWADAIAEWNPRVCILDECHALMSEGSKRSTAARKVTANAEMVWGLSGTPLTNRPRDVWNVADTLRPGIFGNNFFKFGVQYCNGHKKTVGAGNNQKVVWDFDGKSNLPELNARLSHFMLRRTAIDVALQLPPKTRQTIWVDVPAKAQLLPNANAREMRASLDRSADAKLDGACDLVIDHAAQAHKVVAFTWRRSVADYLVDAAREKDIAAELIYGGISTLRRGASLERAKGHDGGHILVATIDSASTGIDLSYADVCVFVELTWEPHKLLQAEARLHRFGQKKPVLIQYIIARGSADELVSNVVVSKLDTFEQAIGKTGETLTADIREDDSTVLASLYTAIAKMQTPTKSKKK